MKKILVTGGLGFIGSHLVRTLRSLGHDVEVFDIADNPKNDITNLQQIRSSLKNVQYVFHLAAISSVQTSIDQPDKTNLVNLTGTLNVLIAAKDAEVKRVILSSSAAVYGEQEKLPISEDAKIYPKSPYAMEKFASEEYLKLFSRMYGLETVSLRYFNVYGEGQNPHIPYASVVSKFIECRKNGRPLPVIGGGSLTRDFVNVSDIVSANISAMESSEVGKGEVINIASGIPTSVKEVAELIGGPIEHLPERLEIKDSLADISLAKKLLDWSPKIDFENGIKELLK